MSDRELLEAAAKAAGDTWDADSGVWVGDGVRFDWNPLESDRDALRLAVKLGMAGMMDVYFGQNMTAVDFDDDSTQLTEQHGSDPYAATRRAIVRAAAALGEKQ
jgi:hypothetical protein